MMKIILILCFLCEFSVFASSLNVYRYIGPKKVHSGRIPANVKIFRGKNSRPLDDKGMQQLLADNLPANDLEPKHKLLYYRARQKDYDFAQFGQPCRMQSLDELEAFLKIPEDSIDAHEGETEAISPAQKGDLLEKLFNHSKTICDFRNLLTCHKHFRTCACAHPSMGLNREGICGVNIGHPCELTERTLVKHNILLTPETNPIKCLLENAECVLDTANDYFGGGISPIRKVCKCRSGYWGATCRRRHGPAQAVNTVQHGTSLKNLDSVLNSGGRGNGEEVEVKDNLLTDSRAFWIDEGGGTIGEYFMHPEQIKMKLLELMNEKGMYPQEYREEEADKLTKRLEMDVDKEEMVVHELHLRQLASLNLGQACEPERQVVLDNPPLAKDGQRWIEPHPDDIKSWQLGLLQDKKPFCNVYKHLRCDKTTRVCQCKPGLTLDSSKGRCVIPLGHNCGPDFDTVMEFDPLRDRKRFSEAYPPECITNTECKDQPLFFQKKCWCKIEENCSLIFDQDKFSSMVTTLQSRFVLTLGDSCDPKMHHELLSYSNEENSKAQYERRMSFIKEIIENPESQLCDIGSHLNCSETSRTCECWKQLKPNKDGECLAINMASCGRTFEYGKYMYPEETQLWQVERTFQISFLPECILGARCAGGDDLEWGGRCVCKNDGKTGEDCLDPRSILATAFKSSRIPNNNEKEMAMIHVFFDLNRETYLLEQLMTLGNDQECDPWTGLKLERIVKFWKEIASSDESIEEKRNLPHFIAVAKWTKYFVGTVSGNSAALCNTTMGLRCHRTSGKCGCSRGARWIDNRCFLDVDEPCDPKPGATWVPTCMNGTKCLSSRRNFGSFTCTECIAGTSHCDDSDEMDGEEEDLEENVWVTLPGEGGGRKLLPGDNEDLTGFVINTGERQGDNMGEMDDTETWIPLKHGRQASQNKLPGSGSPDEGLTKHQKDKYLEEIDRNLKEILTHRTLPFGKECNIDEEKKLSEIFPNLPIKDFTQLPMSIPMVYSILSRLYWTGISFCNRNLFLSCGTNSVCGCSKRFGLIEDNGECRLLEGKYCVIDDKLSGLPNNMERTFPLMKCQRGTNCVKIDYGMPICTKPVPKWYAG